MKNFIIIIITIFYLSTFFISKIYSQNEDSNLKVAYIFNFVKNISWQSGSVGKTFIIGYYGDNKNIFKSLNNLSNSKKIKNKKIKIIRHKNLSSIDLPFPNVIFIDYKNNDELIDLYRKIYSKNVLLITDHFENQKFVMLNFTSDDKKNVSFEINKKTILEQNLKISPELLLLGGSEIDLIELYKKQEKELDKEKKHAEEQKKEIENQRKKLESQKKELEEKKKELEIRKKEISDLNKEIILKKQLLKKQEEDLNQSIIKIEEQKEIFIDEINKTKKQQQKIMKKQRIEVKNSKQKLLELDKEIKEKQKLLNKKQNEIKQNEIKINEKEKQLEQKNIKINEQKTLLFTVFFVLLIIISLSFLLVKSYRSVKKAKQKIEIQKIEVQEKNEELVVADEELRQNNEKLIMLNKNSEKQNRVIKKSKEKIEEAHKNITDSINYAKTIQEALLTNEIRIRKWLKEYFILFKPKEKVSGDFYYFNKIGDNVIVVAADCTGHGVPGGFLTMLGITFLNRIIVHQKVVIASEVLEKMRENVKEIFNTFINKNANGLDIALCILNTKTNIMQYAGAYNPLLIIRNNKIIQYKATKNPIGYFVREKKFENNEIQMKKNDIFYIFSDGYQDQFGGKYLKKFKSSNLRNLLLENHKLPMKKQKEILDKKLSEWKGETEQIDDIVLIGVKI